MTGRVVTEKQKDPFNLIICSSLLTMENFVKCARDLKAYDFAQSIFFVD